LEHIGHAFADPTRIFRGFAIEDNRLSDCVVEKRRLQKMCLEFFYVNYDAGQPIILYSAPPLPT